MKVLFVIALLLLNWSVSAQNIYRTINGTLYATVIYNDTPLVFSTSKLLIFLDYETAEFTMKIDKSTFTTKNDSINKVLKYENFEIIEFKGKLGLDFINTKGHPPLTFELEGKASTKEESVIYGKGRLEHMVDGSLYSCLLSMSFNLKLSDIGLLPKSQNVKDEIQIEIIQIVLDRDSF